MTFKPERGKPNPYPELREPVPREFRGSSFPGVQFATEVYRDGKLIRRNGVPVGEEKKEES